MKTLTAIPFLLAALAAPAALGEPPKKKPVSTYSHLSSNSPFTTKPVVTNTQQADTTFDDWALGGVSPVEGGYMITLLHKKNQGETQVIKPRGTVHSSKDEMKWLNPGAPGSFKVERVEYGKKSWKDTVVFISSGGKTGQMKFDDKQLAPAASAAPVVQNRQPGQPGQPPGQPGQPGAQNPGIIQPNPQNQGQGGRPPRQRVLPPAPNQQQPQTQGRPNR